MANSTTILRTNYFHINNRDDFNHLLSQLVTSNGEPICNFKTDDPLLAGFGCESEIEGLKDENGDLIDNSYDMFLAKLQTLIAPNDACLLTTISYEKLRTITGDVCVITSNAIKSTDLETIGTNLGKTLLNNPDWTTRTWY